MTDWRDKRVLIIGAARQGKALTTYLARQGASIVLNDQRQPEALSAEQSMLKKEIEGAPGKVEFVFGGHPLWLLDDVDLVCPSGGVPLTLPLLSESRARGLLLSNDSQIFLDSAPCQVIGITGSAGKTTTTTLVGRMAEYHLLQSEAGGRVYIGGNIGAPLITWVDQMTDRDVAVVELSSFQLELMTVSPQVAVVLNITPNHLDRHASMEDYIAAKARILEYQDTEDVAVLNREDSGAWSLMNRVQGSLLTFGLQEPPPDLGGLYVKDGWVVIKNEGLEENLLPLSLVGLRGEHNLLNVLAACAVGKSAGFRTGALKAGVEGFSGVAHRMEFIRNWQGADWYNDSIATAPERSMAAIRSFEEPLILLAGGRDKNLPWDEFACLVSQRVQYLVVFGEARDKIVRALEGSMGEKGGKPVSIVHCTGLREAVNVASKLARPGHVVLLSPGGTSFDEFHDFEERGEAFKKWVMELS